MTSHNPLTREFERKLLKLRAFADLVEGSLISRAEALDTELTERAKGFAEEDRQEFFEFHAEDYFELADELPTILRYAVLTAADTGLEVYLNNTCETYAEVNKQRVRLADFAGAGIERSRKYLKKVAGVAFPDVTPAWVSVTRLHKLRNCIVHGDGTVPETHDLHNWSRSVSGLHITRSGTISLDRAFTNNALSSYEAFATEFDSTCGALGLWQSVFPVEEG